MRGHGTTCGGRLLRGASSACDATPGRRGREAGSQEASNMITLITLPFMTSAPEAKALAPASFFFSLSLSFFPSPRLKNIYLQFSEHCAQTKRLVLSPLPHNPSPPTSPPPPPPNPPPYPVVWCLDGAQSSSHLVHLSQVCYLKLVYSLLLRTDTDTP